MATIKCYEIPEPAFDLSFSSEMCVIILEDEKMQGNLPDYYPNQRVDNIESTLTDHIESDDPHPQYVTQSEGDEAYSQKNHNHDSAYAASNHNHNSAYDAAGAANSVNSALLGGVATAGNTLKKLYDLIVSLFTAKFPQPLDKNGTFTLALTDMDQFIRVNSATDCICYIPLNDTAAFSIGSTLVLEQLGAGVVTVTAVQGVTLNGDPKTQGQYKCLALYKSAINTWLVIGGTT